MKEENIPKKTKTLLYKKSIILIFIVSIFTIFSYGFDQLVIRTEDKLRNLRDKKGELKDKIKTIDTKIDSIKAKVNK